MRSSSIPKNTIPSSSSRSAALRWILVPIAAVGAWYAAFASGLLLRGLIHRVAFPFCKDKRVVSDDMVCFDPWFNPLLDVAAYVGAALAAFLILVSCVYVSPTHKRVVALVTYAAGAVVAILAGSGLGSVDGYLSMAAALGAGALTTIWLYRRHAPANVA